MGDNSFEEERDDGYGRFEKRRSDKDWRKFNDKGEEVERECKRCGKWKDISEYKDDDSINNGRLIYCNGCISYIQKDKRYKGRIEKGLEKRGYKNGVEIKRYDNRKVVEKYCLDCKKWINNVSDWMRYRWYGDYCKSCNEYRKEKRYRESDRSIYILDEDGKCIKRKCSKCNDFKDVEEFGKRKSAKYELNGYCKKCWNVMMKERRID